MKEIFEETACLKEEEIKRYLSEQSPKEELHRVENHLLDCPFCSDAIEGLEGYYSFETDKDLEILKAAIGGNETIEEAEEGKVVAMPRRGRLHVLNRIAAAILLLVVPAAAWFYLSNNDSSSSVDFGNSSTMRSGGEENAEGAALLNVITLYEAKQFEAALAAAETMLAENSEDVKTTYYAGLAAMKAEDYNLAADYFMTVRMNSDFYYDEATWLEIQARINAKEMDHAKLILDGLIAKGDSRYIKEAEVLRQTLE